MVATDFIAVVERHHPALPLYLLVPSEVVDAFRAQETFVVETLVGDTPIGRRTVKPWGDGRWFMELTKAHCAQLGAELGDRVPVRLLPAAATPPELAAALSARGLEARWAALTAARRRAIAESVFAAKRAETRARRIERALLELERAR